MPYLSLSGNVPDPFVVHVSDPEGRGLVLSGPEAAGVALAVVEPEFLGAGAEVVLEDVVDFGASFGGVAVMAK